MKKWFLPFIFLFCFTVCSQAQTGEKVTRSKAGSALAFDGQDDVLTVGPFTKVYVNTVEAWVKPASDKMGAVFANGGGPKAACTQGIMVTISREELCYDVNPANCGTDNDVCYAADLTGQWTHFAGTFDGQTAKLYINGKLEKTKTGVSFDAGDWLTIGGLQFFNGVQSFYKGEIDELRVWSVVRTDEEISATMNRPLTGHETGLVGYWKFDEGEGQTANEFVYGHFDGVFGTNDEIEPADPRWTPSEAPLSCRTDDCLQEEPPAGVKEFLKWSRHHSPNIRREHGVS